MALEFGGDKSGSPYQICHLITLKNTKVTFNLEQAVEDLAANILSSSDARLTEEKHFKPSPCRAEDTSIIIHEFL
jgi:hypothetical protein